MDYKALVEKIESDIEKFAAVMDGHDDYCVGFRDGLGEVSRLIAQARKKDESSTTAEKAQVLKTYLKARYELLDTFERDGEEWAVYEDEGYIVFAKAASFDNDTFDRAEYESVAMEWLEKNPLKDCGVRFDKICYRFTGEKKAFVKHIFGVGAKDE